MNEELKQPVQVSPAQYNWTNTTDPPPAYDPVILRRRIKKGYGWAGLSMVFQFLIAIAVIFIGSMVMSSVNTAQYMSEHPDATQQELMAHTMTASQDMMQSGLYLIVITALSYLIANPCAALIATGAAKNFKVRDMFGRIKTSGVNVLLAALAIMGIQGISIFVQMIVTGITGFTGMNEETSAVLSFSDNTAANILLVIYTCIIAPVTEEMLMRGYALNALSPVSRKFGIIASALLFGLMHGNFNQIFNGFLLGLVLGYIAVKSGSVWASVICHMAANINAMFASYFYEYKMAETVGEETAMTMEMIHFGAVLVIGIIALIFLYKRLGKVTQGDCIVKDYSFDLPESETKGLTWKMLLTRPSFWVVTLYYLFTAVSAITAVADLS